MNFSSLLNSRSINTFAIHPGLSLENVPERRKDHKKHQLDTLQFDKAKVFDELKHIYESHSQTHKSVLDMIVSIKTKLEDEFNKFQEL